MPITTDFKGRVTEIGNSTTIKYTDNTARSDQNTYNIIIKHDGTYFGYVNTDGFLCYLRNDNYSDDYTEWKISYNAQKQISMIQEIYNEEGESDTATYRWTYKDMNMTQMSYTDYSGDSEDNYKVKYSYTDNSNSTPIPNKGNYVFTQPFDYDDHGLFPFIVYYAGLLGLPSPDLVLKGERIGHDYDGCYQKYTWNISASGHPSSVEIQDYEDNELEYSDYIDYQW